MRRRLRTLGERELVAAPVLAVTPRGAVRAYHELGSVAGPCVAGVAGGCGVSRSR